jgi:hypothetical protein
VRDERLTTAIRDDLVEAVRAKAHKAVVGAAAGAFGRSVVLLASKSASIDELSARLVLASPNPDPIRMGVDVAARCGQQIVGFTEEK